MLKSIQDIHYQVLFHPNAQTPDVDNPTNLISALRTILRMQGRGSPSEEKAMAILSGSADTTRAIKRLNYIRSNLTQILISHSKNRWLESSCKFLNISAATDILRSYPKWWKIESIHTLYCYLRLNIISMWGTQSQYHLKLKITLS